MSPDLETRLDTLLRIYCENESHALHLKQDLVPIIHQAELAAMREAEAACLRAIDRSFAERGAT